MTDVGSFIPAVIVIRCAGDPEFDAGDIHIGRAQREIVVFRRIAVRKVQDLFVFITFLVIDPDFKPLDTGVLCKGVGGKQIAVALPRSSCGFSTTTVSYIAKTAQNVSPIIPS